jgi:hypothetical protein
LIGLVSGENTGKAMKMGMMKSGMQRSSDGFWGGLGAALFCSRVA